MSERFKKLKQKYLFGAILKSAVCGVSFGLFTAGIILLALKLSAISLGVVWYILIGVFAAAVGFGVAFIFFRPTDKKVALSLDNEFGLEERVQTSLEYNGQNGAILELQRADTEEKLAVLPKSKPRFSKIWQYLVTVAVAVIMAVTAFIIPAKQAAARIPGGDDAPADIGVLEIGMVKDIISDVQKSDLSYGFKTAVVSELDELIVELSREDLTQGLLKSAATYTIERVDTIINSGISYITIGEALEAEGQPVFGQIILRGGNAYRYTDIMEYSHVETFNLKKLDTISDRTSASLSEQRELLNKSIEDGLADEMYALGYALINALDGAVHDSLYSFLNDFLATIAQLQVRVARGEFTDEDIQEEIENIFKNSLKNQLLLELCEQSYTGAMRRFVCNRLKYIFGLGQYEMPDKEDSGGGTVTPGGDPPGGDPDTPGGPPVIGDQYGSDDEVYDPLTGMYRKYKDILKDYEAILTELISSGTLSDEQIKMARDYFDRLRSGIKD